MKGQTNDLYKCQLSNSRITNLYRQSNWLSCQQESKYYKEAISYQRIKLTEQIS